MNFVDVIFPFIGVYKLLCCIHVTTVTYDSLQLLEAEASTTHMLVLAPGPATT